ncbi:MAG: electron transfer flavoprotein subunit beta/FixA family protein [Acidimicrobiia bacterium]|nr:electron transfer flavoprotein subunit beta/FixA family protein [Acidimicrobiia bacterium]
MNVVVPVKLVPDLVEDLEIEESGTTLDTTWLRFILNEVDEHALEQALLLKERHTGTVALISLDGEGVDDVLYASAAKGADHLIKLTGVEFGDDVNNHAVARLYGAIIEQLEPELVLVGVQAHNDLEGSLGPLLAEYLAMPYVGYVSGVDVSEGNCQVLKEYPGGLIAEMEVVLPAVLGVQAAEAPPRYVAISRIRQAMKTTSLDERAAADPDSSGGPTVETMFKPETGGRATMISGDEDEVADRIVELLRELGKV